MCHPDVRVDEPFGRPDVHDALGKADLASGWSRRAGSVQTRIEDVSPEEMERRFADPRIAAAMEYVQRPDRAIFAGGECGRR
ncbi:hypothetical protein [Nocardia fluminea]|uniref:hypothetical protein n=1 Tax=Nocardia fluminea TaxID=134984 RepID=UPI003D0B2A1B